MRLFIAIGLDEFSDHFNAKIEKIKNIEGIKATYPRSFHITLKFFGEVDDPQNIIDQIEKIDHKRFSFCLSSLGHFGDRVFFQEIVDLKGGLLRLQEDIEKVFGKEERSFHPHITLARIRSITSTALTNYLKIKIEETIGQIDVSSFSLFRSELTPQGPRYTIIHTKNLI